MNNPNKDTEEGGEGGGKNSGETHFHHQDIEDIQTKIARDDLLPEEIRHLLVVHQSTHAERVKKQKQLREERDTLRQRTYPARRRSDATADYYRKAGLGSGTPILSKPHPLLSHKAQFSGIDKQVIPLPSEVGEYENTNPEMRHALQNRLEKQLHYQHKPKFHPKPSPF